MRGLTVFSCCAPKLCTGTDNPELSLDKQDQSLQIGKETKEEIVGLRSDTRKHLDDEFGEIRKELVSIKDALARAGIQV